MAKPTPDPIGGPFLSWSLLIMAYATYGRFLHSYGASPLSWGLSVGFAVVLAAMVTVAWVPVRRVILMGFQSDVGYAVMVLVLASLAVLAVVQFSVFAYFMVLVAVSLLVRVDSLIGDYGSGLAFGLLVLLAMAGLGLSWLPLLLSDPAAHLGGHSD